MFIVTYLLTNYKNVDKIYTYIIRDSNDLKILLEFVIDKQPVIINVENIK